MSATYRTLPLPDGTPSGGSEIATSLAFTEGPAVAADGTVYFSDIENNRIMQYSPSSGCQVFRQPSGRTNGQTFDQQGRLYHCEGAEFGDGGNRRVTRTTLSSGEYEVLTEHYDGMRYNSPNDICIDGLGRIERNGGGSKEPQHTEPGADHQDFPVDPCDGSRPRARMASLRSLVTP